MSQGTRQRLRLSGGAELSVITAGEASSLMLDFIKRTQQRKNEAA